MPSDITGVPEAAVLNVDLGHPTSLFQLCLKFSAEFRNILNVTVEVCPLPSNCHISFSVDENFLVCEVSIVSFALDFCIAFKKS